MAMKACGRCWPVDDGPGYMAMCPCDGFTYIGHGGGPRPSLVVVPWETTVVLLEVLPPRFPPLSFLPPLQPSRRLLLLPRPLSLFLPGGRGDAKGGDSGADNVLLE
jgi:hypothetical protein